MPNLHDFTMNTIDGEARSLGDFKGKVVLLVNVASKCGLTPQYTDLEKLHEELAPRGFSVVGFPCNQFAGQEPGTDADVKQFCSTTYGVTFPLFSKIDVNGASRAPLYAWLTGQDAQPEGAGDIKWNFGKFVVDKQGSVVARFDPTVKPTAPEVRAVIEKALK
ncbi:MAG: glutathione peroxidase [Deltaproteobacteria bacterium]|nr:glutathione peroxidase [Deltaproteobacteria bacterium]